MASATAAIAAARRGRFVVRSRIAIPFK